MRDQEPEPALNPHFLCSFARSLNTCARHSAGAASLQFQRNVWPPYLSPDASRHLVSAHPFIPPSHPRYPLSPQSFQMTFSCQLLVLVSAGPAPPPPSEPLPLSLVVPAGGGVGGSPGWLCSGSQRSIEVLGECVDPGLGCQKRLL